MVEQWLRAGGWVFREHVQWQQFSLKRCSYGLIGSIQGNGREGIMEAGGQLKNNFNLTGQ